ncbi:MAG: hypothetical protein QOD99_3151 [Chthoniobacter sp.]|jgi:hypothetical protein|nr:hypothetical protein [Chthoniobacter sp.]
MSAFLKSGAVFVLQLSLLAVSAKAIPPAWADPRALHEAKLAEKNRHFYPTRALPDLVVTGFKLVEGPYDQWQFWGPICEITIENAGAGSAAASDFIVRVDKTAGLGPLWDGEPCWDLEKKWHVKALKPGESQTIKTGVAVSGTWWVKEAVFRVVVDSDQWGKSSVLESKEWNNTSKALHVSHPNWEAHLQ